MPAIITHDLFGRSVLEGLATPLFETEAERSAFLLGNQGPDPLFYCIADPALAPYRRLGTCIHHLDPAKLLAALTGTVDELPRNAVPAVRAWIAGFACHYLLDRTEHPLVYAQQFALCGAGIEGLTEKDGSDVHALIESEIDEMMLFTRTGRTVASFNPAREILRCDKQTLAAISYAFHLAVTRATDLPCRLDLFQRSVQCFRTVQGIFHSPRGTKRRVVGAIERLARPHSFFEAMSHRAAPLTESRFDNRGHAPWENPFTHETSTASFTDLFDEARECALSWVPRLVEGAIKPEEAAQLSRGLDFEGAPAS